MRAPILAAAFAVLAQPALAQPVLEERLTLSADRRMETSLAAFPAAAPAPTGFQTKITRPSIRDHLREYRVRPLPDGVVIQRRFTLGR